MQLCDVPVMLILFLLLSPVNRNVAPLALLFNIVQTATLVVNQGSNQPTARAHAYAFLRILVSAVSDGMLPASPCHRRCSQTCVVSLAMAWCWPGGSPGRDDHRSVWSVISFIIEWSLDCRSLAANSV
jgi:hypothetical protein